MSHSETPEARVAAPRRRRRLALSLRVMMVAVLVVGAWLAHKTNRARDQRRAVRAILDTRGGEVLYDWQEPIVDTTPAPGATLRAPRFLRNLLGDEYFQEVRYVRVGGRGPVPIDTLDAIGRLPDVRALNLAMTRVGPEGMGKLSGMTSLRVLILGNTGITDEALEELRGLTDLEELALHWSHVSDGTRHLAGMRKLRVLSLSHSRLTDEGLRHLQGLPGLRELTIHDNPLSEGAVRGFMARRPETRVEYAFPEAPRTIENARR